MSTRFPSAGEWASAPPAPPMNLVVERKNIPPSPSSHYKGHPPPPLPSPLDNVNPKVPTYEIANSVKSSSLMEMMEVCYNNKEHCPNKYELVKLLLSPFTKKLRETKSKDASLAENASIYPILRILFPDIDSGRAVNYGMKESVIAEVWREACNLDPESADAKLMLHYQDPSKAGSFAGDLPKAIFSVLEKRMPNTPSSITVGQFNKLLDELAGFNVKKAVLGGSKNHLSEGVPTAGNSHGVARKSKEKLPSAKQKRIQWVRNLSEKYGMGPVEQKWIIKILICKMQLGVSADKAMTCIDEDMLNLYAGSQNLELVCAQVADKQFMKRRREIFEMKIRSIGVSKGQGNGTQPPLSFTNDVHVGRICLPMLADRTDFRKLFTHIGLRMNSTPAVMHLMSTCSSKQEVAEKKRFLPRKLRHPPIVLENKLDGERHLVHVKRGIITINSRNSNWYSEIYSPVIGPHIRRAMQKWDVDVILDGEMTGWDDGMKSDAQFGWNRAFAKNREDFLKRNQQVDPRDYNFSHSKTGRNNVTHKKLGGLGKGEHISDFGSDNSLHPGSFQWIKYHIFDILYLDGPDARKLVKMATGFDPDGKEKGGAILNFPLDVRKRILYALIDPQPNFVEHVRSLVVNEDGSAITPEVFFTQQPERPDSASCDATDDDEQIEKKRAREVDKFYNDLVLKESQEGIIVKELTSPYRLGTASSRHMAYWRKLKPCYAGEQSAASDIDALVLGAYYADGKTRNGRLTSYLCGLLDDDSEEGEYKFMTFCKVTGHSMDEFGRAEQLTGFFNSSADDSSKPTLGKWFTIEENKKELVPSFVSKKSLQFNKTAGDYSGWIPMKKDDWPHLWIHPKDSFMVEIKASEVVESTDFSAGVCLRFPRIQKIRLEGVGEYDAGEKHFSLCDSVNGVKRAYADFKNMAALKASTDQVTTCKFLTVNELNKDIRQNNRKKSYRKPKEIIKSAQVVESSSIKKESNILKKLTFCVLPGTYKLDQNNVDCKDAKKNGYFEDINCIQKKGDVEIFIFKHGGKCVSDELGAEYVLGGRLEDAKVQTISRGLERLEMRLAEKNVLSKAKLTKKEENDLRLSKICVLNWLFIFRVVAKMKRNNLTRLIPPRSFDYLVLNKEEAERLEQVEDAFGDALEEELDNVAVMRMFEKIKSSQATGLSALSQDPLNLNETVSGISGRKKSQIASFVKMGDLPDWQVDSSLDPSERWIMQGSKTELWPYTRTNYEDIEPLIVFPNCSINIQQPVYEENLCPIRAVLPLVHAMGGLVSERLHDQVGMIIVKNMKIGNQLTWAFEAGSDDKGQNISASSHILGGKSKARVKALLEEIDPNLREKLEIIEKNNSRRDSCRLKEVKIVSVDYLRDLWDKNAIPVEEKENDETMEEVKGEGKKEKNEVKEGEKIYPNVDVAKVDIGDVNRITSETKLVRRQNAVSIVLMVGLPGSGKSTFAMSLCAPDFVYICQDLLKSRKRVEDATRKAMAKNISVVIDRLNSTALQRSYFISIAKEFNASVSVVVMDTDPGLCNKRCCERVDHPTITSKDDAKRVIEQCLNTWENPRNEEGIHTIYTISNNEKAKCKEVLERLKQKE